MNKNTQETLAQREDRVANAMEHDIAADITPTQDPDTLNEIAELIAEDPTFLERIESVGDAASAAKAETTAQDALGGDGGDV